MTLVTRIDIETAPLIAMTYGTRNVFIGLDQVVEQDRMICFAAKEGDAKTKFYSEWMPGGREAMLRHLHRVLSDADVLVHFNGNSFDEPWVRRELKLSPVWKHNPPQPWVSYDLYYAVRGVLRFSSMKLQNLAEQLLGDSKVEHGGMYRMYAKLMWGTEKEKAWARRMYRKYNIHDVDLLVALEEEAKGWVKAPNWVLLDGRQVDDAGNEIIRCHHCKSANVEKRGFKTLRSGKYPQYHCLEKDCGGWSRSTRRVDYTSTVEVH